MDARFHELAKTANPKSGSKRGEGFGPWVILFLSVFFGSFIGLTAEIVFVLSGRFPKIYEPLAFVFLWLGMFAGWPAITHYRMRKLFPIRCTAFFASACGIVLAVSPVYRDVRNLLDEIQDPVLDVGNIFLGLVMLLVYTELSALRSRYAYSEKTGQWLRCYAAKKRLVADPKKPNPETFAEILALEAVKKRFGIPQFALFLDTEPDGMHYLYVRFPSKFFSLKFSQPKSIPVILLIDWQQVEQLRARFGEFKKTFTIPLISIAVGDAIRKQAKQG